MYTYMYTYIRIHIYIYTYMYIYIYIHIYRGGSCSGRGYSSLCVLTIENTFYSEHILYESTRTHLSFSLRCRAQVIFRVNDTHIRFLSLFLGQTSSHLPSGRVRNTLGAHKEHIRNTHYSELKLFTLWAFSLEVCWCYLVSLPQCLAAGLSVMCALSVENTFYR